MQKYQKAVMVIVTVIFFLALLSGVYFSTMLKYSLADRDSKYLDCVNQGPKGLDFSLQDDIKKYAEASNVCMSKFGYRLSNECQILNPVIFVEPVYNFGEDLGYCYEPVSFLKRQLYIIFKHPIPNHLSCPTC